MNYKIFGVEFNILNVIICIMLGFLISVMIGCDCVDVEKVKESFQNMRTSRNSANDEIDVNSMLKPIYSITKNTNINNTKSDQKVMPASVEEDKMFYLCDDKFKPECCPSTYSNSVGCYCLSKKQYNFLNSRGGNRTHVTQF